MSDVLLPKLPGRVRGRPFGKGRSGDPPAPNRFPQQSDIRRPALLADFRPGFEWL